MNAASLHAVRVAFETAWPGEKLRDLWLVKRYGVSAGGLLGDLLTRQR
jgi:hypothetical protein